MAKQSQHRYVFNVLFDDDDDGNEINTVTSNGFRPRYPPQPMLSANSTAGPTEEDRQKQLTLMKIQEIENQTLDSASRSLAMLRDSEEAGVLAADSLASQGEQLQNTNTKLDGIINNLSISQKHINGIRSIFSGIKNYISRKSDPSPLSQGDASPSKHSTVPSSSRLGNTIGSARTIKHNDLGSYPAARLHGLDGQSSAGPVGSSQHVDDVLDENLSEMTSHISNLKELGQQLGKQIDLQNDLINIIHNKAEVADIKIGKQNKQMRKILEK